MALAKLSIRLIPPTSVVASPTTQEWRSNLGQPRAFDDAPFVWGKGHRSVLTASHGRFAKTLGRVTEIASALLPSLHSQRLSGERVANSKSVGVCAVLELRRSRRSPQTRRQRVAQQRVLVADTQELTAGEGLAGLTTVPQRHETLGEH